MRSLAFAALLLPLTASAQPPAPVPPPDAKHYVQHTWRWEATCPGEEGTTQKCWVYVVRRYADTDCARADTDGDGAVGVGEFTILSQQYGCKEVVE